VATGGDVAEMARVRFRAGKSRTDGSRLTPSPLGR